MFLRLQEWLRSRTQPLVEWADLNEGLVRSFLQHGIEHTADKGNDFSRLRTLYRWGVARQHQNDPAFLDILLSITAVGNAKGHSVRFRDVVRGPFSPDELMLISRAVQEGLGAFQDRAVVMLHLELGHNPNASVRLRNSDLIRYETKSGVVWQLDVPRVKKRIPRRETKRRPISGALGSLSLRVCRRVAPMDHCSIRFGIEPGGSHEPGHAALCAGSGSHLTTHAASVEDERAPFPLFLATHMAEEGASIFHIAEVLDHTDTQNARVYIETASSIADPVTQATDSALTPLVRRFQGRIIESDRSLTVSRSHGTIPAAVPYLGIPHLDVGGIGLCGRDAARDGLCQLLPPLSCYMCPSFAALRTGPHRQMLESIDEFLRRHEQLSDRRILLQLDQVRVAIRQAIEGIRASEASAK